jgi:hypothetical protein
MPLSTIAAHRRTGWSAAMSVRVRRQPLTLGRLRVDV